MILGVGRLLLPNRYGTVKVEEIFLIIGKERIILRKKGIMHKCSTASYLMVN